MYLRTLLVVGLSAASLSAAPQTAAAPAAPAPVHPQLFTSATRPATVPAGSAVVALQTRLVEADLALLRNTPALAGPSGRIALDLFQGTALVAEFERLESAYGGGFVWHGTILGHADSSAIFSVFGDAMHGTLRWGHELVQVDYAGGQVFRLTLVDESAFPECGTNRSHEIHVPGPQAPNGPRAGNPPVDVMVVYTTAAKNATGGSNGMASKINLAISETNSGYTLSGVSQQLNLVHTEEMVGYAESSFGTMLSDLRGTNDGKMDQVHPLRDQYAADAVALICQNGQYCGMAYLMTFVSQSFASSAFSVTNYSCATGYYSFGHELGHNFGSAHDPGNAGSAAYWYSYGFRTSNSQYRTIMAYSPGTRVNRWSSPTVTYAGYTMGTSSQDNARSLNDTAPTVSNWRVPLPTGPTLNTPTLAAGQGAVISVDNCTANGTVFFAYSTTGNGPTSTAYGNASLSAPFTTMPSVTANGNGSAALISTVPAGTSGVTIWFQALDLASSELSNGVSTTIL